MACVIIARGEARNDGVDFWGHSPLLLVRTSPPCASLSLSILVLLCVSACVCVSVFVSACLTLHVCSCLFVRLCLSVCLSIESFLNSLIVRLSQRLLGTGGGGCC